MIVLDASVLIALLDTEDAHHDRAEEIVTRLAAEGYAVSPLTLAEVLVAPARTSRMERARSALKGLALTQVGLLEDAPVRLAELRAATGARLPDCCVLLAATQLDGELITFDSRLANAAVELGLQARD